MNKAAEQKFLQALEICKSLVVLKRKHSTLPCEAIQLLCEVAKNPSDLLGFCERQASEVELALSAVEQYARSIDNWRAGDCPFGAKDHCNILWFLLNARTKQFEFFRAKKTWTPEVICKFLKDWKGIDLTPLLEEQPLAASQVP